MRALRRGLPAAQNRRGLPAAQNRRGLLAVPVRCGLLAAAAVFGLAAPALAQSSDPSFRVNNKTRIVINEIYVSSANDSAWGQDLLGQNVLPPGQTYIVRLPQAQCMNDIRVVFADGQAHERRRVDTCQITDYDLE